MILGKFSIMHYTEIMNKSDQGLTIRPVEQEVSGRREVREVLDRKKAHNIEVLSGPLSEAVRMLEEGLATVDVRFACDPEGNIHTTHSLAAPIRMRVTLVKALPGGNTFSFRALYQKDSPKLVTDVERFIRECVRHAMQRPGDDFPMHLE